MLKFKNKNENTAKKIISDVKRTPPKLKMKKNNGPTSIESTDLQ